ncbi:1-deoxy-D-xylulose-5-phosphate synthase [Legionella massiliensis]|uniref:1-deoxy-D-xylulose-5-phosphate synthase n=1 Tax=Legionella massiliensis TaxID=1034943 RepID=A0A078KT29_9GAMM|nr:transketolase C-terminal domain-containing protein [Legionella massiliensis]CDZ76221.1 1-deoxy-D-xylulose-5-phosphate synthase [Legionella massiliensis]CEE11959.1 1-deoxy-D-xylulose-5-phosphate synthase [Legionella massiliensis]
MRTTFIAKLIEYAKTDRNLMLVTGDLGYSVLEPFQQQYPEQFINAGIAEQNMTGVAAGLALSGKKVVTYSIANFPTIRCLEQIRNDVCYHNADVKVVSVGSGFAYGTQGYTHHGIEDIAVMRSLPHMRVFSPACPVETTWALEHLIKQSGPGYIRLAKQGEPALHKDLAKYKFPAILPLITGHRDTILSTGVITQHVYKWLQETKLPLNLYSVPVIKPLDLETLTEICEFSSSIYTVEEHQLDGGFGSAILEAIHSLRSNSQIERIPLVHRFGIEGKIQSDMTTEAFATQLINAMNTKYAAAKRTNLISDNLSLV